jgi:hypothetical protein
MVKLVNMPQVNRRAVERVSAALLMLILLLAACMPASAAGRQGRVEIDTVIVYTREGGIAGISQEWVIHSDGTIDGPGDQQSTVAPEEVMDVIEMGVESDVVELAQDMATPDACCDQFTYTLTVISGDEEWSVVTTDTTEEPEEVLVLFSMVQTLIAKAEPLP